MRRVLRLSRVGVRNRGSDSCSMYGSLTAVNPPRSFYDDRGIFYIFSSVTDGYSSGVDRLTCLFSSVVELQLRL